MTAQPELGVEAQALGRLVRRAVVQSAHMIWAANQREGPPGEPKVGGHPAASASAAHILGALHLVVRSAADLVASKPHAAPMDHALHHLLGVFADGRRWLEEAESAAVLDRLRRYPRAGELVLQSYHAASDPDGYAFLPSGSVGIPPVVAVFLALAARYAKDHGHDVPPAHFWALIGDSEFREGSLAEALPEAAERELGNVTWIVDYNRQNLDGPRTPNRDGLGGTDANRILRMAEANGWRTEELSHGPRRRLAFAGPGGAALSAVLERGLGDAELQALLLSSGAAIREHLTGIDRALAPALDRLEDGEVEALVRDLGGHDLASIVGALLRAKRDPRRPTLILAHTVKGWGLPSAAEPGNHSSLPSDEQMLALLRAEGLDAASPYARFAEGTAEGRLCLNRGRALRAGQEARWSAADAARSSFSVARSEAGPRPDVGVDLRLVPVASTQYAFGQIAAKWVRYGEGKLDAGAEGWGPVAARGVTLAPDVGTSTQLAAAMDGRVYGPEQPDLEARLGVKDRRRPGLSPRRAAARHLRFEIAEANAVSALAAFGTFGAHFGVDLFPVMTVYDFFIKRALDQLFYALYVRARFILVGTPSGVTLAPEGAQHSWKSDIGMPNLVIWEPFFGIEVDWALSESWRRAAVGDDEGRQGVVIRAVTRGIRQALMLENLRAQHRFRGCSDDEILASVRLDALAGGYRLVCGRGQPGYEPGENVATILFTGAVGTEALEAARRLREDGIFLDVVNVTCADLLLGHLGHATGYRHLREGLGLNGDLHLVPKDPFVPRDGAELLLAAGRRVPAVVLVDGEPGILDNVGSVLGVPVEVLAVRLPSKSGQVADVYRHHGIDADAVVAAVGRALTRTALEEVRVSPRLAAARPKPVGPEDLWPPRQ